MKVAMFSHNEAELPAWAVKKIRDAGIDLACRKCGTEDELVSFAADADVLWFWGSPKCITATALERLKNCRAVFRSGSGIDAIPHQRARELGIAVCNTPDSIAQSVAEHTAALLLALVRDIPRLDRQVRRGVWETGENLRWSVGGRTLGLIGYGRIARKVETLLGAFRVKSVHFDPFLADSLPLDELLRTADFVSVHCPLTDRTRHLLGAREFALMKRGALLVNTSRGPVLDQAALIDALASGHLGGAALDVTDPEPIEADSPLLRLENVILTPHIAAFSGDFEKNFWTESAAKLNELASCGGDWLSCGVFHS